MFDRQPTNAGRVRLVPVAGQTHIYDMSMADGATEQGTPLNKATLLSDIAASLFNLGVSGTPNGAFEFLGKFNEYCWKRKSVSYHPVMSNAGDAVISGNVYSGGTFTVAKDIELNGTTISLKNPYTITTARESGTAKGLANESPIYYQYGGITYFFPQGSTYGFEYDTNKTLLYSQNDNKVHTSNQGVPRAQIVTVSSGESPWEFVYSQDRNAYPDSGVSGGYEYEYLGVPFGKLPTAPQIETGSYVGTGTYGSENKNTLTFSFTPKILIIPNSYNYNQIPCHFIVAYGQTQYYMPSSSSTSYVSWNGNTVSWYNRDHADSQNNKNNTTYRWIAIG